MVKKATVSISIKPHVIATPVKPTNHYSDDEYNLFMRKFQNRVDMILTGVERNLLFRTDAENLFGIFLNNLPPSDQQYYNCRACRKFIDDFGGLVTISNDGILLPIFWDITITPKFFKKSVTALRKEVLSSNVISPFVTSELTLGYPVTDQWTHISAKLPRNIKYTGTVLSASQVEAEKIQDFEMLSGYLEKYPKNAIKTIVDLLRAGQFYRSDKVLPMAEWFLALKDKYQYVTSRYGNNIIWAAVASAPSGFCHVAGSMLGSILDDHLSGNFTMAQIKHRFEEKMNPTKYQRPQAPPKAGNVARAEKIVEALNASGSLSRRYARLSEIQKVWSPKPMRKLAAVPKRTTGVFAGVGTKSTGSNNSQRAEIKTVSPMTVKSFIRDIVPNANKIEYMVPNRKDNFCAITTAKKTNTVPILQWDNDMYRNPFSWYLYNGGSVPMNWGITEVNKYRNVTAITNQPSQWILGSQEQRHSNQGEGVIFILEGIRDSNRHVVGNALFPEILKSEFHEIRSTIEAYSKNERLSGYDKSDACGLCLQKGGNATWDYLFRVTTGNVITYHKLIMFE